MNKKTLFSIIGVAAFGLVIALVFAGFVFARSMAAAPAQQGTPTAPTAPNSGNPQGLNQYSNTFMESLAKRLNVTVDALKQALIGAAGDTIDQAQKDGNLTADQAQQLKQHYSDEINSGKGLLPFGGHGFRGERGGGHGGGFGGLGADHGFLFTEFAKYLNVDMQTLESDLQSGKTIADIASAQNVDINTVKQNVLNDYKAQLDQHVQSNEITQAQEDQAMQKMSSMLDTFVTKPWNMQPFHNQPFAPQVSPTAPAGTGG